MEAAGPDLGFCGTSFLHQAADSSSSWATSLLTSKIKTNSLSDPDPYARENVFDVQQLGFLGLYFIDAAAKLNVPDFGNIVVGRTVQAGYQVAGQLCPLRFGKRQGGVSQRFGVCTHVSLPVWFYRAMMPYGAPSFPGQCSCDKAWI